MNCQILTKTQLEHKLSSKSISKIARELKIDRKHISSWMKTYNLKSSYFTSIIDNNKLQIDSTTMNMFELSKKYNCKVSEIKRRLTSDTKIEYSLEKLQQILFDIMKPKNQGITKILKVADTNVYNSILKHTKNHVLQSRKLTERVYRIQNNYKSDQINKCSCGNILKFYTYELGYGNSKLNLCIDCNRKLNGVSQISQKLFWSIKEYYSEQVYFSQLNKEIQINVTETDKKKLGYPPKLNKGRYYLDFVYKNKIIEFDGEYYHKDVEKEESKDKFLKYKGYEILHVKERDYINYPKETLEKCLVYLKQQY